MEQFSLRVWQSWLLMVWTHSNDSQSDIDIMSLEMTTFIKSIVFNTLIKLQCSVTSTVKKLFRFQKLGRLRHAVLAYPGSRIYTRKSIPIFVYTHMKRFYKFCNPLHPNTSDTLRPPTDRLQ